MRHLVYVEPGIVEWQEVPDPDLPDAAAALVRPLAVARCDLDASMAAFGIFPGPFPVGHEVVAEVLAVGSAVRRHHVGDRVVVPFQVSCGACAACGRGHFAACEPYRARAGAAFGFGASGGGHGGAVADVLVVPAADHLLLGAPAGIDATALCTLADNVVDAYRAVGPALAERPGSDVLVLGGTAASIGLYAVALAAALGAGRVRYVDTDPERVDAAGRLGAEAELLDGPWPHHVERAAIVVDNTGDAAGLTTSLRSTQAYGLCTAVSIHFDPTTPVPLLEMYTRGVTLHVSRADSRRFLPTVLDLVASGRFDPLDVPHRIVPWDQADEAWLAPATKLIVSRV